LVVLIFQSAQHTPITHILVPVSPAIHSEISHIACMPAPDHAEKPREKIQNIVSFGLEVIMTSRA
jgi:hypothetical protein